MTVVCANAVPDRMWEDPSGLRTALRTDLRDRHHAAGTRAVPSEPSRLWDTDPQKDPHQAAVSDLETMSLEFESRDLINLVRRLDALAHPSGVPLGDVITLNEAAALRRFLLAHARATTTLHQVKRAKAKRSAGALALIGAALIAIAGAAYGVSLRKGAVSARPVPVSVHMAPFGVVWDDIYLARPLSDARRLPLFLNKWNFAITDITSSVDNRQ
jgi:hypothetical protein